MFVFGELIGISEKSVEGSGRSEMPGILDAVLVRAERHRPPASMQADKKKGKLYPPERKPSHVELELNSV